jgi:branched-chain amino acid aminotransferase
MTLSTIIPTAILTARGLEPTPYHATSLADAAEREPAGVYTVARTYQRDHVLLFADHIDRLEQSARLVGLAVKPDRTTLRQALKQLIDQSGYAESRFRITIPQSAPDQLILSIEPYKPVPPDILLHGARLATVHQARANPTAKTTAWIIERQPAAQSLPPGTYEGLLVTPDGTLLEGLSCNFYAILNGVLRTAGDGVLPGMAQRIVFKVAEGFIPLDRTPITLADLPRISEAFISSAGRGIVPVIQIDDTIIGNGTPGAETVALQTRYNAWAEAHWEALV